MSPEGGGGEGDVPPATGDGGDDHGDRELF